MWTRCKSKTHGEGKVLTCQLGLPWLWFWADKDSRYILAVEAEDIEVTQ